MIFDSILNKERYREIPWLYEALCSLEQITAETLPHERLTLDGTRKFIVPKRYETEPEEQAAFEAHRLRADIHYMLRGIEGVQTADLRAVTELAPFSEEKDCGEYAGPVDGTYWLRPGYFALVLPGEVHRTGIMNGQPEPIVKAVYKYQVDD